MAKYYDEAKVVRSLCKKPGVNLTRAFDGTKVLQVTYDNESIGNGSWGKIDFLTRHCGYILQRVDKIHGKVLKLVQDEQGEYSNIKTNHKRDKLNIANMVKNSMKNIKRM